MGWFEPVQPFLVDGLLQVAFALWLQHFGTLVGRTHTVCRILWNCLLPCLVAEGISILREMEAIDGQWLESPFGLAIWV